MSFPNSKDWTHIEADELLEEYLKIVIASVFGNRRLSDDDEVWQ